MSSGYQGYYQYGQEYSQYNNQNCHYGQTDQYEQNQQYSGQSSSGQYGQTSQYGQNTPSQNGQYAQANPLGQSPEVEQSSNQLGQGINNLTKYGQTESSTQYGQSTNQYGQNSGQYGQGNSQYGQSNNQYVVSNTQYGQNDAQYGQNSGNTQYGQSSQNAQFGQTSGSTQYAQTTGNAQYGQSTMNQYSTSNAQYGQNSTQYGQSNAQYGQSDSQYGQSDNQYGQSSSQYGNQFGQSSTSITQYGQTDSSQYGQDGNHLSQNNSVSSQGGHYAGQSVHGGQYGQTSHNNQFQQNQTSHNNQYGLTPTSQNSQYGESQTHKSQYGHGQTSQRTQYGETSQSSRYANVPQSYHFGQSQTSPNNQYGQMSGPEYSPYSASGRYDYQAQPPPPPPAVTQQSHRPQSQQQIFQPRGGYNNNATSSRYNNKPGTQGYWRAPGYGNNQRGSRGGGGGSDNSSVSSRPLRGSSIHGGMTARFPSSKTESTRPFASRGFRGGRNLSQRGQEMRGRARGGHFPERNIQRDSEEVMTSFPDKKSEKKMKVSEPAQAEQNVPMETDKDMVVSGEPSATQQEEEKKVDIPMEESESRVEEVKPETSTPEDAPAVAAQNGNNLPGVNPEMEEKLKELIQPLYCKLCNVSLNAASQAQQHYDGKNHAKKVRLFLLSGSSTIASSKLPVTVNAQPGKPEAEPDTTKVQAGATTEKKEGATKDTNGENSEPAALTPEIYCKICDVSFTSTKQSTQHYEGKNHAKKIRTVAAASALGSLGSSDSVVKGEGTLFECVLCSVHVTSQDQLNMHLNGAKHKNKLQIQQRAGNSLRGRWAGNRGLSRGIGRGGMKRPGPPFGRQDSRSGYGENISNYQPSPMKRPRQDFSNFRTPSGKFYCSCCNVTLHSESQFAQHVTSRRHKMNNAVQRNTSDYGESGY